MIYKLTTTLLANNDLDNIIKYVAINLCNKQAALNFINEYENQIKNTCLFPHSIKPFKTNKRNYKKYDIRQLFVLNYTVLYLINENETEIIVLSINVTLKCRKLSI